MKKITLLTLMLFLSFSGFSQISEGFEGSTLPDVIAKQWVLGSGTWGVFDNGVGTTKSWNVNTGVTTPPTVHGGTRAAYMDRENIGVTNTSRDYLATPQITIPTNGELKFWTRTLANGNQGTIFKIMVSTTSQTTPAAYTLVQQWTEDELTATYNIYEEKSVNLAAYAGQNVYIAFVMEFTQPTAALGGDRWLVDDMRIVEKCLDPTALTATAITQNSATLGWSNPGNATNFEIQVLPFSGTLGASGTAVTGTSFVATGTTTPIAPFTPTTQYKFYVRAICAGDVASAWVGPFSFSTSSPGLTCTSPIIVPSALPYTTTDNTVAYGDSTDIMQAGNCAGVTNNYMTGNDVFYSYTPDFTGAIQITMTPGATYSAIFVYEGCPNVGVNCVAGVANAQNTIRTIPSLSVTAGTTYIIVLSSNALTQTFPYTLTIQQLNCASPTSLSAIGTGPTSANLSWGNPGNATSWEVVVQTAGSPIPTGAGTTANTNTNFPVTSVTGSGTALQLGTAYQYWVRANCGDGTFSIWSGPYVFNTTSCASGCNYIFTMTDTFGDGWNGNTMNVVQNGLTIATLTGPTAAQGQAPVQQSVPMCDGPFELVWNAGGNFGNEVGVTITNSFGQIIYTKPTTANNNSTLFTGTVDCSNLACLGPLSVAAATQVTTYGATLSWILNGPAPQAWEIYAVAQGSPAPTATTVPTATATTNPYIISGLLADTIYVYYVRSVCSPGVTSPWSVASAPFTTLPTCPKPTNLTATNIGMTSASLGWTPGGTETTWRVFIQAAGLPIPAANAAGWITTTSNPLVINTLTTATNYDFYVQAVCSPTDSSTIGPKLNFNTMLCEAANQCNYVFTVTDTFGDSWNGNTMNITQNGIIVAVLTGPTTAQGSVPQDITVAMCNNLPFQLFWNAGGNFFNEVAVSIKNSFGQTIFIKPGGTGAPNSLLYSGVVDCDNAQCLPPLGLTTTNITADGATLSWTMNGTIAPLSWDIYAVPEGSPAPTATTVPTVNTTNNPYTITGLLADTNYVYYVRAVCGTSGDNPWSVVSSPFKTLPTCPKPTAFQLFGKTDTTAILGWTAGGTETTWNVLALPAGSPAPTATTTGWQTATAVPYTYTGLTAGTSYVFYVRAVCSSTDSSTWTGPISVVTLACPLAEICTYTFSMTDAYGDGWNGNTMNVVQNGLVVTVLTGPTFADGQNPSLVSVSLCNNQPFSLIWNTGGSFGNEIGISIQNSAGTAIFTHTAGTSLQGTTLFTGTVTCTPNNCPTPIALSATSVTETSAVFNWFEAGTATAWEIIILPATAPAPTAATPGISATSPYLAEGLTSGVAYKFYVRAICSANQNSDWAGPKNFFTLITNDECTDATLAPVNSDQECGQIASGSLTGATASSQPNTCFGAADDDVWFEFTATNTSHSIKLFNIVGSTTDLLHAVYSGDSCGDLTLLYCSDNNTSIAQNLVVGQTYTIRVYSYTDTPNQVVNFDLCIGTIPPSITVTDNQYTPLELVEQILLDTTCANVSNVTWSTGTNFGSDNGIGYFEKNGSSFPFENGIVLTTGLATNAMGPNDSSLNDGDFGWGGDTDLQAIINALGQTGQTQNATKLEFDFVPLVDNISFNFLFASEEYGIFQCSYSDVFAFILTNVATGVSTNLAVLPNGAPISVTTIRDQLYNAGCPSVNPDKFGAFYDGGLGLDPLSSPTNFNGITVPLTAMSAVIPGQQYHIKLAIADYSDSAFDSAVFLEGGSFGLGNISLGDDLLIINQTALCSSESIVLNSELDTTLFEIQWSVDGTDIVGATGASISVDEPGTYTVTATYIGTTCAGSDSITVEFYPEVVMGTPENLFICGTDTATFDLTQNDVNLTNGSADYIITYHLTEADAIANVNPLTATAYENISNPQIIYARVELAIGGCFLTTSFQIEVQDLSAQFTLPADTTICEGETFTIAITPSNFDLANATYTWTLDGVAIADTNSSITVTTSGTYEVTVNFGGCVSSESVTLTVLPNIILADPADVAVCDSYTLPALTVGNYFTATQGGGTALLAGDTVSTTQTIYVYAVSGTCFAEQSFEVVVTPTPVIAPIANVVACGNYTLPTLVVGNYFTEANGQGTPLAAGTVIDSTQVVHVYATSGTTPDCTAVAEFTVTIVAAIVLEPIPSVSICSPFKYELPVLAQGNYFTQTNGGGQQLQAGDEIASTQTIYVFASGATPECNSEVSFTVTVTQSPMFAIQGNCVGQHFVLTATAIDSDLTGATYLWTTTNDGGVIVGSANEPTVIVEGAASYMLTVTVGACSTEQLFVADNTSCMIQKGISPNGDG
ncbi:MAG: choice-of-anchor L domain-containing protein, partial [Flavobacterium sp.]